MSIATPNFNPLALLTALNARHVEYIVIGGIAATIRGSDSITADLDICYRRTKDNAQRLAAALSAVHANLVNFPEGLQFQIHDRSIWNGELFTLTTDHGRFDCLANPAGTSGFDDLHKAATLEEIDGISVMVCSLDDLIRMKEAAGRIKDRIHLEQLYSLKRLLEKS